MGGAEGGVGSPPLTETTSERRKLEAPCQTWTLFVRSSASPQTIEAFISSGGVAGAPAFARTPAHRHHLPVGCASDP